jgi:flagellar FliJ protein
MAKRFPLQPLHDLANDRLDAATRKLAQLKQRWQAAEDKLAQLRGFREEYQRRLGDAVARGMDMTRMRDFHAFIGKIETAIRQQLIEIERNKSEWEEGQRMWLEERRKLKTYDVLKDRHVRVERARENRIEQREQDEHARKTLEAAQGGQPPAGRKS